GRESNCDDFRGWMNDGTAGPVVGLGGFAGGIWVQRGEADPAARVVRGMVPFHALNLQESYAYDGYGSRIHYVVTASQTSADNFLREGGAVSVIDSSGAAGTAQTQTNHFLVFSVGPDRAGGYSRDGREMI